MELDHVFYERIFPRKNRRLIIARVRQATDDGCAAVNLRAYFRGKAFVHQERAPGGHARRDL